MNMRALYLKWNYSQFGKFDVTVTACEGATIFNNNYEFSTGCLFTPPDIHGIVYNYAKCVQ